MNRFIKNRILKRYKIISFDIFDTLMERNVNSPTDIFKIAGGQVLGTDKGEKFRILRINAENTARKKSKNGEIELADIYRHLEFYTKEEKNLLMEQEIHEEILSCYRKNSLADFFQETIQHGKEVYLISDMYLPEPIIKKMLLKCGISGYKALYISNKFNCNKISGELFKIVKEEHKLDKANWIHIGDSIKADYLGAHKAGVHAMLIGRKNRFRRLLNRQEKKQ